MPELDLTQNLIPSGQLVGTLSVGGGTTDYNALENKPSINSVTLTGNKTSSDLGLVNSSDLSRVATTGNFSDLTGIPNFNYFISFGYNTTTTTINSTSYIDFIGSPQTVTLEAGQYLYMIMLNAKWTTGGDNFYTSLNIDGTVSISSNTYAQPQENSICIFCGTFTVQAGSHILKPQARVTGSGTKEITIPNYAACTCILFRKG